MNRLIDLEKLQKYMKENKISEVKLAKMIGVDYSHVYRVFRGKRRPGTKFIAGLINCGLGLEFKDIFLRKQLPDGNKDTA